MSSFRHSKYILIKDKKEALPKYFRFILKRLGMGFLIVMTGSSGAKIGNGKSVTALRIAELIDPDFNIDKVTFTPYEFLKALKKVEESGKSGQCVILDEAEVSAASQRWQSIDNEAIAHSVATFRYLKCCVIFVAPSFGWLDKRLRTLVFFLGKPQIILEKGKRAGLLKFYQLRTDFYGDKIFPRGIRYCFEEEGKPRRVITMKTYKIELPSKKLMEAYEKKDLAFKRRLREKMLKKTELFEQALLGQEQLGTPEEAANSLLKRPEIAEKILKNQRITSTLISILDPTIHKRDVRIITELVRLKAEKLRNKENVFEETVTLSEAATVN